MAYKKQEFTFRIGDRVRIAKAIPGYPGLKIGRSGRITRKENYNYHYAVLLDGGNGNTSFFANELELIERKK